MKLLALIIILAASLQLLVGCASAPKAPVTLLIQPLLDRIVPADFRGDGDFGERGQYIEIEIRAGDLHKTAAGWTWKWLAYRRTLTIPIAPGVPYRQSGWITLGTPTVTP